jgi:hypothetical protein
LFPIQLTLEVPLTLLALQAPFDFANKSCGMHVCEKNETNLMQLKQNSKQVQLEQHDVANP